MRVTQEADYAIRICLILDSYAKKMGASEIAVAACITQKEALKVLRKLNEAGYVRSYKGMRGGYEMARHGADITVLDIIEVMDGPVLISKCLECDHHCSKNACKTDCNMHIAFGAINRILRENLGTITVKTLHDKRLSASDIADIINKNYNI